MYILKSFSSFILLVINLITILFISLLDAQETTNKVVFSEVFQDFPREEKNLRKWGAPIIADLDHDGFLDVIINDHGFSVKILWNNQGKFAKPYDENEMIAHTVGKIISEKNSNIPDVQKPFQYQIFNQTSLF